MGTLADSLGGKISGDLIRSTDWNTLITEIESIQSTLLDLSASVNTRLQDVDGRLQELDSRVESAETNVSTLSTTVENLKNQFRRVTLHTEESQNPFGHPASITAQISDILGGPLDLSAEADRPWIDFVATWGHLKPVPGFESSEGTGDRTISVQVNAAGKAQVLLQAEPLGSLSDEEGKDVQSALRISVQGNGSKPVFETIMGSSTPSDDLVKGALDALSVEYDRDDAGGLRACIDQFYMDRPIFAGGRFGPSIGSRWRDCRSTVIALAKPDSNPVSPDPSLGACSIQVTFRDWIGPWIAGYTSETSDLVDEYRDRLIPRIDRDFGGSASRVKEEVLDILKGKGIVGRQRDYAAIQGAMRKIILPDPPPFLMQLTQVLEDAVSMQQTMEYTQIAAIGVDDPGAAFSALADGAVRSDIQVTKAREELTSLVQDQMGTVQETVKLQVRQQQQDFQAALTSTGGIIGDVEQKISAMAGKIDGVHLELGKKADISLVTRVLPDR